jgi:hypothetical protein
MENGNLKFEKRKWKVKSEKWKFRVSCGLIEQGGWGKKPTG